LGVGCKKGNAKKGKGNWGGGGTQKKTKKSSRKKNPLDQGFEWGEERERRNFTKGVNAPQQKRKGGWKGSASFGKGKRGVKKRRWPGGGEGGKRGGSEKVFENPVPREKNRPVSWLRDWNKERQEEGRGRERTVGLAGKSFVQME